MPDVHERVFALAADLAHLGYLAAVGTALTAALAGWTVATLARKRIAWAVDLDLPVGLTPGPSPDAVPTGRSSQDGCPGPDEPAAEWLVLVTITNTGHTLVRGGDFRAPLVFGFPGREVCDARLCLDPVRPGCLGPHPLVLPAAIGELRHGTVPGSGRVSGVALGNEMLLRPHGTLKLWAVLRGTPAPGLPAVSQEGALLGGAIIAPCRDGVSADRWSRACATGIALLAALLLGLLIGAGS
jgi:hypothetical protein